MAHVPGGSLFLRVRATYTHSLRCNAALRWPQIRSAEFCGRQPIRIRSADVLTSSKGSHHHYLSGVSYCLPKVSKNVPPGA